jgi:hypothetical protein
MSTAVCARCKIPLEITTNLEVDNFLACPVCGEGDTVENVAREVGEYVVEKRFSNMLRGAAENSTALTFTEGPKRVYRFVADDKP